MSLTFKERYGENWKKSYFSLDRLRKVFDRAGLEKFDYLVLDDIYEVNENRAYAYIGAYNEESRNIERVYIEVKSGTPQLFQLLDGHYGFGKDCEKKIIICDGSKNPEHEAHPYDDVTKNTCYINGYLYLFKRYGISFELFEHSENDKFTSLQDKKYFCDISIKDRHKYNEMPSREEFEKSEFWFHYFDRPEFFNDETPPPPFIWLGNYPSLTGEFEVSAKWDGEGFFLSAIPKSEEISNQLKSYGVNEIQSIKALCNAKEVYIDMDKSAIKINIKMIDTPFIYRAKWKEYGRMLFESYFFFENRFFSPMCANKKNNPSPVSSLEI